MRFTGPARPLTGDTLQRAADCLGLGPNHIWALLGVADTGLGFLADRRPVILFERHKFHQYTDGRFAEKHPDVSNRLAGGYGAAGKHQYERLERAMALDRTAALMSTSWGLGQLMGFNAQVTGFASIEQMVDYMCASEDRQAQAVFDFIDANDLAQYLRNCDWTGFALRFNGLGHRRNRYHERLASAYHRHALGQYPDLRVRTVQAALTYLGYGPGAVDGLFSHRMQAALVRFQKRNRVGERGKIDADTYDTLFELAFCGRPDV